MAYSWGEVDGSIVHPCEEQRNSRMSAIQNLEA
jgi:hypothetical protein